jgi:hypothetical protein
MESGFALYCHRIVSSPTHDPMNRRLRADIPHHDNLAATLIGRSTALAPHAVLQIPIAHRLR